MKLAIDTHHLLLEQAGTRRVTINLLKELHKREDIDLIELKPSYSLSFGNSLKGKILRHFFRFFWVHIQVPVLCSLKKVDVLLSPEFNTPFFTWCKKYVIVHDAHMRVQREFNSTLWFYLYYIPFIEMPIRRADVIFTISAFSKQEIIKWMKINEKKIAVIYWGVDPLFLSDSVSTDFELVSKKYNIQREKYLFFIGTSEARKNLERIVEAFGLLHKRMQKDNCDMKLVIAGGASVSKYSDRSLTVKELVQKLGIADKVIFCGFVPDNQLVALYSNAFCLLFPSLYEGFGFPIVEGFATGVPVITSNIGAMSEIASNAALLVDPYSIADIEAKIYSLFENKDQRQQLIEAGNERVKLFSWSDTVEKMITEILHYKLR